MVAPNLPAIEPGAPSWFQRWAMRLPDFFVSRYPGYPVRVPTYAATANLPAAAAFSGCLVFNTALGQPCVSDGAFWYPITLGAHL